MQGMIVIWSGAIGSIPTGWHLCDGTAGTPDLRDRFVVGAGSAYDPDDTGGVINHNHSFTSDTHFHNTEAGVNIASGANISANTSSDVVTGSSNLKDGRPPYYALAYIMKL